jgi:hypothetical protein
VNGWKRESTRLKKFRYTPSLQPFIVKIEELGWMCFITHLGDKSLAPIVKTLRTSPRTSLKGLGILHDTILHHRDIEVALDFHVFKI